MAVAALVASVDRGRVHRGLHLRLERVLGDGEGAGEVGELAAHLGDDEVTDDEADGAVTGVDGPGAGGEGGETGGGGSDVGHENVLLVYGCEVGGSLR